jgi:transposase
MIGKSGESVRLPGDDTDRALIAAHSARAQPSGECGKAKSVVADTRPVDFRRGADGLAATAQTMLRQDPFCGTIFVFRSKRADRVQMLVYDGTGLVLIWKRLEGARFKWPVISDGVMRLTSSRCERLRR